MPKQTIPIKGMHCRSCETLIREALEEVPGVKKARASYKDKEATIFSDQVIHEKLLVAAVQGVGYDVGNDEEKPLLSQNPADYVDLGIAFAVLLVLYFIFKWLGLTGIGISSDNPSSLLVVLLVGLTAGISTCMALVGGLVLGISAQHAEKHPEATSAQKFRPHLFFNIGRIASYFVLGGLIGLIGKAFQLTGPTLGVLTIAVGLVMLVLGLQLTEIFPRLSSGGLTLPESIGRFFGIKKRHKKEYSHKNSLTVGALTFFLPCGFTQAMQLYAMSTGSFWSGALIMSVFAIGTAPGLLSIGGLTSVIKGVFAKKFFKFAGLLVAGLALFNMSNGWNLTGWNFPLPKLSPGIDTGKPAAISGEIVDGVLVVKMTQDTYGYSPSKMTILQGVPVKWVVDSVDSRTCAASLISSQIGVRKSLKPGENIIEFTPKETGQIKFSCSMGMYRGSFEVIANKASLETIESDNEKVAETDYQSDIQKDPPATETKPEDTVPQQPPPPAPSQEIPQTNTFSAPAKSEPEIQVIRTVYTDADDIIPSEFTVKSGLPVRMSIDVKDDGYGCMSTVMIPGLVNEPELLEKGKTITFDFTPYAKGNYEITCAMGVPRGTISVV